MCVSPVITAKLVWSRNCLETSRPAPAGDKTQGVKYKMKDLLLKLYLKAQALRDERGQDMVEYCVVVGFIALAATAAMGGVANQVSGMFNSLGNAIQNKANAIT